MIDMSMRDRICRFYQNVMLDLSMPLHRLCLFDKAVFIEKILKMLCKHLNLTFLVFFIAVRLFLKTWVGLINSSV